MQSNFTFLKTEYPILFENCYEAEKNYYSSPRTTLFYTRRALEFAVKLIYKLEGIKIPSEDNLMNLISGYDFVSLFEEKEKKLFDIVRKVGNIAAHGNREVTQNEAITSLEVIYKLTSWIAYCYGSLQEEKEFDISIIPTEPIEVIEMRKLLKKEEEEKNALKKEIEKYKHKEEKKTKEFKIDKISEADTRKMYIDLQLKEVGWDLEKPNVIEYKVFGMPKEVSPNQIGYVDYVLWGDDGKPLAVVEAKKAMKSPKEGQHQAKLYADCLEQMTTQRPIIFYTNGFETYIWDDVNYPPRQIYGFYRKEELKSLIEIRNIKKDKETAKSFIDSTIAGRVYQIRAITKVIEHYNSKYRKALLVMATGSGKTRTTIALIGLI
ncbi:MAG: DUF4145 domain-containing protein [Caldisericia bacterium]|nr:DUF4145 domain-containing protein [Caldisericia bacterium]